LQRLRGPAFKAALFSRILKPTVLDDIPARPRQTLKQQGLSDVDQR
jgi:hypothetical protein